MNLIPIDQKKIDNEILRKVVKLLQQEEVIIHPTDTVYGIAGRFDSPKVIEQVNMIKGRSVEQPFSIMVNSVQEMIKLSGQKSPWLKNLLNKLFPNPVTVLLYRRKRLTPGHWNRYPLLGFRCPDHLWSQAILQECHFPLITTSANFAGEATAKKVTEISAELINKVAVVLDGGETHFRLPSTILKIEEKMQTIELIRPGAMPWEDIQRIINRL